MGKSASNWSNRISAKKLCVLFACLILFSSAWITQVSGAAASTIHTVDASGRQGSYVSLASDSNGYPGISYYDFTNYSLKYAHWNGINWAVQVVDASFISGIHTSVAFDANDNPHISYDGQNQLRYAKWNGSVWNIQTVDASGSFTSIAIDAKGYPHISYYSVQLGNNLKYASWTGTSWNIEVIDAGPYTGEFTSLKLDNAGYPHISYWDFGQNFANQNLKVAFCNASGWYIQLVDSGGVGQFSSLDLDVNGNNHIAYFDNASRNLKYAVSNGANWAIQVVDSAGDVGTDCSLALDANGYPHISYTDNTNHYLKYVAWNGSNWKIQTLRYAGYVGEYTSIPNDQTSIKINKDNDACIAYCDWGNYYLKYITAPTETGAVTQIVNPFASITAGPNPIGVGQTLYVGMSIKPNPPQMTDRFEAVILTVTNPDGTQIYLGPFLSEPNGLLYTYFTPTQVGKYRFQMNYTGQFFASTNATYLSAQSEPVEVTVQQEPVTPKTWTVSNTKPADFTSIQEAINAANIGDTVYVYSGVYKERQININKPLTLLGENKSTTILDGNSGSVRLYVQNTVGVTVSGFAIVNGFGLYSAFTQNVVITDNIIWNSSQGLILGPYTSRNTVVNNYLLNNSFALMVNEGSHDNTISRNIIAGSKQDAICLSNSNANTITENYLGPYSLGMFRVYGLRLMYSNSNYVFHNDIVGIMAEDWNCYGNAWDNGYPSGGNYWGDYTGKDANNDGIGDTAFAIYVNATDRYPLMNPYVHFNASNLPAIIYPTEPALTPTPTPTPTNSSASTSTSASSSNSQNTYTQTNQQTDDYSQYWEDNQQGIQDTDQQGDSQDTTNYKPTGYQDTGPFPVVETVTVSIVSFSICVGVILFLKRWE